MKALIIHRRGEKREEETADGSYRIPVLEWLTNRWHRNCILTPRRHCHAIKVSVTSEREVAACVSARVSRVSCCTLCVALLGSSRTEETLKSERARTTYAHHVLFYK